MKTCIYIGLFAIFGIVAVQGLTIYGTNQGPMRRQTTSELPHGPVSDSKLHESPHGRAHEPLNSRWPHGSGRHRPNHRTIKHRCPWHHTTDSEDEDEEFFGSSSSTSDEYYSDQQMKFIDHAKRTKRPCRWPHDCRKRTTTRRIPITTRRKYPTPTPATFKPIVTSHRPLRSTPSPPTKHSSTLAPLTNPPRLTSSISTTILLETTTEALPETTSIDEEEPTTSVAITNCIASCPSTPEFHPVCGSNDETYDNEGKLFCANICGVNVTLRRRSVCPPPPPPPGFEPSPPLQPSTTSTQGFGGRTITLSKFVLCTRQCHINGVFSPVCGTNFVTYMNIERLACAQSCGEDVEVLCEKPCAACGAKPGTTIKPRTISTLVSPTTPSVRITSATNDINNCIESCPMISTEYKPVCGSNGITYNNPGNLLCAQVCGISVTVAKFSACSSSSTFVPLRITELDEPITTEDKPTTILSPTTLSCIRSCPVTSEYNPVCGSDDLTYYNPGHLDCAQFCGVDVELRLRTPCATNFDPDSGTNTPGTIKNNRDIETSTSSMTTTLRTKNDVSATTTSTIESPTTQGVEIPSDILDKIFGNNTSPPNDNDESSTDIDIRFGVTQGT